MGAEDMYTLVADEMVARWRAGTVAEYIGERGLLDGYRWELCGGADDYEPKLYVWSEYRDPDGRTVATVNADGELRILDGTGDVQRYGSIGFAKTACEFEIAVVNEYRRRLDEADSDGETRCKSARGCNGR